MNIQPVQVAGGIHIPEAGDDAVFHGDQRKMLCQGTVPCFQVHGSRGPGIQLLLRVILCVDRMHGIEK